MKFNVISLLFKSKCDKNGAETQHFSPVFRQILVALGPWILTVSLGMTSGYSAVLLPQLQSNGSPIIVNDEGIASWIASIAALPMAFGCIVGGLLMEKFGRRLAHIITTLPCLVGWLTIAFATNIPLMLIGRFLTGICGGLLGPTSGVYIAETSDPKIRGFLLAAISLAMAVGLLLIHVLGTFLEWKVVAMISCSGPIMALIFLMIVPESPSWLAKHGKITESQKAFYWCRGHSEEAKREMSTIVEKQSYKPKTNNIKECLKEITKNEFLRPLFVIIVFIVSNQWAGVNAITFYSVSIIKRTLGHGLNEYLAMIIVDTIRVFTSLIACLILRRIGRRPLAIISGIGTFSSLFVLSGYSYLAKINPILANYPHVPMVALVTYISFISVGFVPLPWAMMGEVFPLVNRNIGTSISSMIAFTAFFSVVKTGPVMFESWGADGTFLIYGLVAMFGTIFAGLYLPETKDKTLQEIEDWFKKM